MHVQSVNNPELVQRPADEGSFRKAITSNYDDCSEAVVQSQPSGYEEDSARQHNLQYLDGTISPVSQAFGR